jgi:3-oxoacyl-[acyl-carrier-protein] synthase II
MSAVVRVASYSARTVFGGLASTWEHLLTGKSICDHARAELDGEGQRAIRLAQIVASDAVGAIDLDPDAAIIVGTSKGSIEDWLRSPAIRNASTSDNLKGGLSPGGLADVAQNLCRTFGMQGPILTLSAACASGLIALIRGAMMIQAGEVRQALIVAAEASIHPLFLGSFQRLGVLAKPGDGCKPFDQSRTGFYMSEAAAAVVLQAADSPDGICIDRFAMGGDATHLTGGDPEARVLRRLLTQVIDGRAVDLIHAHGTGTELNDATELAAIDDCVHGNPGIYSHKASLGHSLGASGLLSIVINCQSHAFGKIPPNVRTTNALKVKHARVLQTASNQTVRRSVAIAAGFGGPTAVVSLASEST